MFRRWPNCSSTVGASKSLFKDLKNRKVRLKGDLGLFSGLVAFVRVASARRPDLDHLASLLDTYDNLGALVDKNPDGSFGWTRASRKIKDVTARLPSVQRLTTD